MRRDIRGISGMAGGAPFEPVGHGLGRRHCRYLTFASREIAFSNIGFLGALDRAAHQREVGD